MTAEQAANRQADHENLIREMAAIIQRYVNVDDMQGGGSVHTRLYRDAKAVLAKVQS